jgi:hypothetical protein
LSDWKAAIDQAGLKSGDRRAVSFLARQAGLDRVFAFFLLQGEGSVTKDQAERIKEACRPLIEARERAGELRRIGR